MPPTVRRLALTAHVSVSVGWLGAVAAFLALAITGLDPPNPLTARAAYIAMGLTTSAVLVPASLLSLVTGTIQALGTPWGLVRHYWVIVKLAITPFATAVLFLHTRPIGELAGAASASELPEGVHDLRVQLVLNASAALLILLTATALSVLKPRGRRA